MGFEAGATYQLPESNVDKFVFTHGVKNTFTKGRKCSFTFTPTNVINGHAFRDTTLIATAKEFSLFECVIQKPQQKKPFKKHATYVLLPEYVDQFMWRPCITTVLRRHAPFSFTATDVSEMGAYSDDFGGLLVALSCERHMFRRVDNK